MRNLPLLMLALCAVCLACAVACGRAPGVPQIAEAGEDARLALLTAGLPDGVIEQPYVATLEFTESCDVRLVSGALPPGVVLSRDGRIAGTPGLTGDWNFTLLASCPRGAIRCTLGLHVAGVDGDAGIDAALRSLQMRDRLMGLMPEDAPALDANRVELGRLLFFDRELSGTRDVSCATCHHPAFGFSDGLNLAVGVGATGLGPQRSHPGGVLVPRNSPAIYNTGLMPSLFWDKRVRLPGIDDAIAVSLRSPTITPDGSMDLEPVEAQALFPMADHIEMRGHGHELDGLDAGGYRSGIVRRLQQIPEYVSLFERAFGPESMTVDNMARAIGDFERSQTYVNSPWDRYLLGERRALSDPQKRGATLFFDRANCANCHSGPLLSDFVSRSVLVPQFGPGKGTGAPTGEDFGVEDVARDRRQRYGFRTPSLRNVALTAPYMHNGAFGTLREVVVHYRDKGVSARRFTTEGLAQREWLGEPVQPTAAFIRSQTFLLRLVPDDLTDGEIDDLVAFLESLTDPAAVNRMDLVPDRVPSGLPVDR
ncbi:MAG: c-type cytochrome [Planctomycetes bacterium]|nr:c-type cytochrome [Planctomycetota bacterium]